MFAHGIFLEEKNVKTHERNGTKGNKKKKKKKESQIAVIIDGRMNTMINHLSVLNDVCMQICG